VNPFFSKELAQEHIGDLRRQARKSRVPEEWVEDDEGLTVRAATGADGEAVRLLAALEGVNMPTGQVLVAQVGDDVVAALPLQGGQALADPFRRTAQYVELLQVRAKQLRALDHTAQRGALIPRIRGVLRAA
jgi:hypothetical protein